MAFILRFTLLGLILLISTLAQAGALSSLQYNLTMNSSQPRYERLPLFAPHRKEFTCVYQDQHVPPIDPQAEAWFQQALALDDPNIWYEDKDYAKMYQLYLQAAQRNHWKAILNLASLILKNYPGVPERGTEPAIKWVEKAMQLGVPDAYDRMGTYHQNGIVRGGGSTAAYAFFQKAADMGSPAAMTFFGDKLGGTYDDPGGEFWGNLPIATQMLECAFAQGFGQAAYELGFIYKSPNTPEAKLKALHIFHEGVKLGCAKCAGMLSGEFRGIDLPDGTNLVPTVDQARAERYTQIAQMLRFYEGRLRLPNLDKVLPLPPVPLPKWDGDKHSLINAAKGVIPVPKPASAHPNTSLADPAYHIPAGYTLPKDPVQVLVGYMQRASATGFWQAVVPVVGDRDAGAAQRLNAVPPRRYTQGEMLASFQALHYAQTAPESADWLRLSPEQRAEVQWHYYGEAIAQSPVASHILVQRKVAIEAPLPEQRMVCNGAEPCPATGVWRAMLDDDHPLAKVFQNTYSNTLLNQSYVQEAQAFPNPQVRGLDIDPAAITWHWMGQANDRDDSGYQRITIG